MTFRVLNPTVSSQITTSGTVDHSFLSAWHLSFTLWDLPSPALTVPLQFPLLVPPPLPDRSVSEGSSINPGSSTLPSALTASVISSCLTVLNIVYTQRTTRYLTPARLLPLEPQICIFTCQLLSALKRSTDSTCPNPNSQSTHP